MRSAGIPPRHETIEERLHEAGRPTEVEVETLIRKQVIKQGHIDVTLVVIVAADHVLWKGLAIPDVRMDVTVSVGELTHGGSHGVFSTVPGAVNEPGLTLRPRSDDRGQHADERG